MSMADQHILGYRYKMINNKNCERGISTIHYWSRFGKLLMLHLQLYMTRTIDSEQWTDFQLMEKWTLHQKPRHHDKGNLNVPSFSDGKGHSPHEILELGMGINF